MKEKMYIARIKGNQDVSRVMERMLMLGRSVIVSYSREDDTAIIGVVGEYDRGKLGESCCFARVQDWEWIERPTVSNMVVGQ